MRYSSSHALFDLVKIKDKEEGCNSNACDRKDWSETAKTIEPHSPAEAEERADQGAARNRTRRDLEVFLGRHQVFHLFRDDAALLGIAQVGHDLAHREDADGDDDEADAIAKANDTEFGFDLVGYEYMQYAEYHTGGHQRYHTDIRYNFDPGYIMEGFRKMTTILMLSDPSEYEGGELQTMNSKEPSIIDKKKGLIAAFPGWALHRVTPVTSGIRKTLVVWIAGPQFK